MSDFDIDLGNTSTKAEPANHFERKLKLQKKIPDDVIADLEGMDVDTLRQRIVACEKNVLQVEEAQKADTQLAEAKETVKQYSAPYREAKTSQRSIATYAAILLDEKGK